MGRNEMEYRLNVEDRGPVDAVSNAGYDWLMCCVTCNHVAHLVIRGGSEMGERTFACPRCLVFLDEKRPCKRVQKPRHRMEDFFGTD